MEHYGTEEEDIRLWYTHTHTQYLSVDTFSAGFGLFNGFELRLCLLYPLSEQCFAKLYDMDDCVLCQWSVCSISMGHSCRHACQVFGCHCFSLCNLKG